MEGAARYIATFALAFLITFGLFWIMQALIDVEATLDESQRGRVVDFVRLKRESEAETKKREMPDKKPPEKEPPPPDMNLAKNLKPDQGLEGGIGGFGSDIDLSGGPNLGGMAAADQDVVPLVRVNPEYPVRAAQRGVEGWVEVEFTISKAGTVKSPHVIGYEPSKVFNTSALRAIRKWKYNPKIENGVPVERPGVIVRLKFGLAK